LRIAPVVNGSWVEILARAGHHDILAPVEALVATIERALNVEVPTKPIGAHADTDDAGIHRAEQSVGAIVSAQTKPNLSAGGNWRRQRQSEPEEGQTTPRG
jgi:hypothetical protein